jgi:hypothetical protein
MTEKDNPDVQKARIADVVHEVLTECEAVFDENCFKSFVRFRIDHTPTGNIAAGPVSDHASVFADYSDDYLRDFITELAPQYARS